MVAYIAATFMNEVFKALADASRRRLLDELHRTNGRTLAELSTYLSMTRQAVTKHLKILEAANLLAVVWHGREKLHFLNPVPLHEIYERWISKYERPQLQALSDLKRHLESPKPATRGKSKIRPRHPLKTSLKNLRSARDNSPLTPKA